MPAPATAHDAARKEYWDGMYARKAADEVSWFQAVPSVSLEMIRDAKVGRDAKIVDIGGGASSLAAFLLEGGYHAITVLDVAGAALEQSKRRLGVAASAIEWLVQDVV